MGTRVARGFEKHSWTIFLLFGFLAAISAPINLRGTPPNPPPPERMTGLTLEAMDVRIPGTRGYIGAISRQLGNFLLAMGVLIIGVAAVPYRKGERWAWYTFWIIPINLIIQLANSLATGGFLWQVDFVGLLIVLAGLVLPYRKFFPIERVAL